MSLFGAIALLIFGAVIGFGICVIMIVAAEDRKPGEKKRWFD